MIIGIALVVDELHKGQRLVYRYPEAVPSSVLNSTEGLLKFHQDYQSLSPDNFAKLFRPKASLFNKILELTIDDLHYISFPCPCSDELSNDASNQTATDVISLFNVVIATVRESAIVKLESIPRSTSEDQRRSLFSKKNTAGSDPVAAALGLRCSATKLCPSALRRTVETISRALLNQEKRSRYVSRQVALMLRLQEEEAQRGPQNQISNAQQQSVHVINESSATAKKAAPANTGHSSNEMSLSARKKNKSGDALQHSLSTMVVPTLEGASRSSNPNSIAATPTSRSSSALEVPTAMLPGTITVSPSGILPGIWTVSPQRTASPPLTSTDTTLNVPVSAVDKDGAGLGAGLGSVPLSVSENEKGVRGAERKPTFDKKLEVMESMQMFSTLANELRMIYHGLIGGHSVNLTINNTLAINIRLSKVTEWSEHIMGDNASFNDHRDRGKGRTNGVINPPASVEFESGYQTMLCIADKEEILDLLTSMQGAGLDTGTSMVDGRRGVPAREREKDDGTKKWSTNGVSTGLSKNGNNNGSSSSKVIPSSSSASSSSSSGAASRHLQCVHPVLEELLSALDPTVSLEMLSDQLEQPLSEILKQCRHLQEWGLGSLIPTITSDRKYRVIPMSLSSSTVKVCRAFKSVFQEPLNEATQYLQSAIDKQAEDIVSSDQLANAQILTTTAKEKLNRSDDSSSSAVAFPRSPSGTRLFSTTPMGSMNHTRQSQHIPAPFPRGTINADNVQLRESSSYTAVPHGNSRVAREYGEELQHCGGNIENRRTTWSSPFYGQTESSDANAEQLAMNSSCLKNKDTIEPSSLLLSQSQIQQLRNDKSARKSVDYTLLCVLSVFDGGHTLEQSIRKLPAPLQPFGVDIVVWLLRRRLISEIGMHLITLEQLDLALTWDDTTHSADWGPRLPTHCNDDLGNAQQMAYTDMKTTSASDTHSESFLMNFTENEREAYSRLLPYFNGLHSLNGIAWSERMLEEDILKIVRKSPHIVVFSS